MARAPKMTPVDKHAIKSMVSEGFPIRKIAQLLKRGDSTIKTYIEKELGGYPKDIDLEEAQEIDNKKVSGTITDEVIGRLTREGTYRDEAKELVFRTVKQVTVPIESADQLYRFCVNNTNVRNIMPTKSAGGRHGVAVMTAAASQRLDARKSKFVSKTSRSHIYRQQDD